MLSAKVTRNLVSVGKFKMSSSAKVWIDKNTKVICQGFTGDIFIIKFQYAPSLNNLTRN
jgi:hypothetical protein